MADFARLFLRRYADLYNKGGMDYAPDAVEKMNALPWYGNIRELQHAVEKAVILSDSCLIHADDIEGNTNYQNHSSQEAQTLDDMERDMIVKAIDECEGNLSRVAARLGISRQTLYNKMKKYGV